MKTIIEYKDNVELPGKNYDMAFTVNIEIKLDQPGVYMTDEEYKKVTEGIKKINNALAPYRLKASNALIRHQESEERKARLNPTK